jgi:hypothetical protein
MTELAKSEWAKVAKAKAAKAEQAMPEATKAELAKALANAELAKALAKAELAKALANAELANANLAKAEFATSELTTSELEPEFHDQHRIGLLTALKAALKVVSVDKVSSVLWAHLWLSDIDMLEDLVKHNVRQLKPLLVHAERPAAVVQKCEFINFYTFS